jgi:hypothetical protein
MVKTSISKKKKKNQTNPTKKDHYGEKEVSAVYSRDTSNFWIILKELLTGVWLACMT